MTREADAADGERALAELAKALGALLEDLSDARRLRLESTHLTTPSPVEHEQAVRPMMPPLDEPTMDDEVGLRARHLVGVENILWSTDFPHPEYQFLPNGPADILDRPRLTDADKRAILGGNVARALGLG